MDKQKSGHEGKKHKRGKPPVIVPKHISDWAKQQSGNPYVVNYLKGGGKPQK